MVIDELYKVIDMVQAHKERLAERFSGRFNGEAWDAWRALDRVQEHAIDEADRWRWRDLAGICSTAGTA